MDTASAAINQVTCPNCGAQITPATQQASGSDPLVCPNCQNPINLPQSVERRAVIRITNPVITNLWAPIQDEYVAMNPHPIHEWSVLSFETVDIDPSYIGSPGSAGYSVTIGNRNYLPLSPSTDTKQVWADFCKQYLTDDKVWLFWYSIFTGTPGQPKIPRNMTTSLFAWAPPKASSWVGASTLRDSTLNAPVAEATAKALQGQYPVPGGFKKVLHTSADLTYESVFGK